MKNNYHKINHLFLTDIFKVAMVIPREGIKWE